MDHAEKYVKISDEEKEIIIQARISFLISGEQPWIKKDNDQFDLAMGSFDGAEIAELVGLYLRVCHEFVTISFRLVSWPFLSSS